jgi:polyphenol oxidase
MLSRRRSIAAPVEPEDRWEGRASVARMTRAQTSAGLDRPPVWAFSWKGVEVRFLGRGPHLDDRRQTLGMVEASPPPVAAARQVHSTVALEARAGHCGEGDALYSAEAGLAVSVITADCVPVMVAGDGWVAAVHAGWRGLAAGILPDVLAARPRALRAWIGPAIGPCCYEVGDEVATAVVAVSGEQVRRSGRRGRPHVDLVGAAEHQLRHFGVEEISAARVCTRCHPELLWSYRRDGARAGRNVAYIWRR